MTVNKGAAGNEMAVLNSSICNKSTKTDKQKY